MVDFEQVIPAEADDFQEKAADAAVNESSDTVRTYAKYPGKNLRFLIEFFNALGMTPQQYANMTDNPNNYGTQLRIYLKEDDMKVGKVRSVLGVIGFDLKIKLMTREELKMKQDRSYVVNLPDDLKNPHPGAKNDNLLFLADFLRRQQLSVRAFGRKIGVSPSTIMAWLKVDDMRISYIDAIQKAFDAVVEYNIVRKD